MALSRVYDESLGLPHGLKHFLKRWDAAPYNREIFTSLGDITPRAAVVILHVDDQEGRMAGLSFEIVGFGLYTAKVTCGRHRTPFFLRNPCSA